jgi:hypothetical protein
LIAWKTKKQTAIFRSSAKAELCALACVIVEVTWLQWLLVDFGVALSSSTLMHCDNTGAISIAQDPVKYELTKQGGVNCFYVQSGIQDKIISLQYVPSEIQLAILFTKVHTRAQHCFLLSKLNMVDPP